MAAAAGFSRYVDVVGPRYEEHVCVHCGATFSAAARGGYGNRPTYCKPACRQAAYRARQREAEPPAQLCECARCTWARFQHQRVPHPYGRAEVEPTDELRGEPGRWHRQAARKSRPLRSG